MKFGVFDHVDCSGVPLQEHLENRMKIVEAYDRCGLHAYHVAEHHGTPLGYATSPTVYLAALAQRTKRIRIGALIHILPLYNPLRLIEEIGMLDHMTGGRLMLGMGRGASPIEAAFFGIPKEEMQERYVEASNILLQGLQSETLTFEGKHFSFRDVPMTMRPLQQPYPDLWYAARTRESFEWAAKMRANVVTLAFDEQVREMMEVYRTAWTRAGNDPADMPLVGVSRHVVVADTDAEAKRIAARAYDRWLTSFRKLWVDKKQPVPLSDLYPDTWEELEARRNGCAGSPETVRRFVADEAERCGCNYLVSWFAFGDMTVAEVTRSVELFSRHVMPSLEHVA